MEFYKNNPKRNIEHPEIVDWCTKEYQKRTSKIFRDPDRAIRLLHQKGFLQKIKKGVYRYEPDFIKERELEDFTPEQKAIILKNVKASIVGRLYTQKNESLATNKGLRVGIFD